MRATVGDWQAPDYTAIYEERCERLRNLRALDPEQQAKVRAYYALNPIDWIEDWAFTWDPMRMNDGRPALIPLVLFDRQKQLIKFWHGCFEDREDGVVEKSREMGVSWCAIAYAVWMWIHKPGTVIGFGSYEATKVDVLGVTDSLLEKARVLIRHLPREMLPVGLDTGPSGHMLHKRLLNPQNGSQIVGEIGDNIGRGARATMYFVDEAAFLKHAEMVDGALASTSDCKIYISTAYGMGAFYQKTQSDQFRQFRFHWRDDPRKDDAWYEAYLLKWGPTITAREVDINHQASVENICIPGAHIEASRKLLRAMEKAGLKVPPRDSFKQGISGLDVGGGRAPSVFIARFGPYVNMPKDWKDQHGDTTITGQRALRLARQQRTQRLNFDAPGVGTGVSSTLRHSKPEERALAPMAEAVPGPSLDESKQERIARLVNEAVSAGDDEVQVLAQAPVDNTVDVVTCKGVLTGGTPADWVHWPDGRTSREWFVNLRAEIWWTMRVRFQMTYETWLHVTGQEGGALHPFEDLILLPPDHDLLAKELASPTWHEKPGGKIGLESKKELAARGVKSPDFADAFALTFVPQRPGIRVSKVEGYF